MRMLVSETPFHPTLPTADAAGFRCSWTHWNLPRQIVLPYLYLAIMMLLRSLILLNQNNHEWNTCPHARALASSPASTLISLLPPEIAAAWCKWPRKKKKRRGGGSLPPKARYGRLFGFRMRSKLVASFCLAVCFCPWKGLLVKNSSKVGRWNSQLLSIPTVNPVTFFFF